MGDFFRLLSPLDAFDADILVQIITPALARLHASTRTIPTLKSPITYQSTLRQIRTLISNELGIVSDAVAEAAECNCAFARQIEERALRNGLSSPSDEDGTLNFIVVHGRKSSADHADL